VSVRAEKGPGSCSRARDRYIVHEAHAGPSVRAATARAWIAPAGARVSDERLARMVAKAANRRSSRSTNAMHSRSIATAARSWQRPRRAGRSAIGAGRGAGGATARARERTPAALAVSDHAQRAVFADSASSPDARALGGRTLNGPSAAEQALEAGARRAADCAIFASSRSSRGALVMRRAERPLNEEDCARLGLSVARPSRRSSKLAGRCSISARVTPCL